MTMATGSPGSARQLLQEIQAAVADFQLHSLDKTLQRIKNFAAQNQYLDVAVLGQFKAGKSSFLNAYLGRPLLPVGEIPVTAVISRIRFGEQERATITFQDGRQQEIPLDGLADYVSESGNPGNRRLVQILDLETPALGNIKALRLVDTPGIGSVWQHNTETTTNWFPETGGVLFVISAERPISESEMDLLREIYQYTPEITILITKSDLFSEAHLTQIEIFIAAVLDNSFGARFPIRRYSTIKDTARCNAELDQEILGPLARHRDARYQTILEHKIETLARNCLTYLQIAHQASRQQEAEKCKLKVAILDEHLNTPFVRRDLQLISASYKEKTRESIRAYLNQFRPGLEAKLSQAYGSAFDGWSGNLYQVTRQFETWMDRSLQTELQAILLGEEKSYELLGAVRKHLAFYLKSFRERLGHNLEQALGIQPQMEQWEIEIAPLERPDISIGRVFDNHLDLLWFLFPMFIFRGWFRRSFYRQIAGEIEKNLHRLTSDLNHKINKEIDSLVGQAFAYMNQEINLVENLLTEERGDSRLIAERLQRIEALLASQ